VALRPDPTGWIAQATAPAVVPPVVRLRPGRPDPTGWTAAVAVAAQVYKWGNLRHFSNVMNLHSMSLYPSVTGTTIRTSEVVQRGWLWSFDFGMNS
jgi:hypothetical protein